MDPSVAKMMPGTPGLCRHWGTNPLPMQQDIYAIFPCLLDIPFIRILFKKQASEAGGGGGGGGGYTVSHPHPG